VSEKPPQIAKHLLGQVNALTIEELFSGLADTNPKHTAGLILGCTFML